MDKNNGGPAFPNPAFSDVSGMSLRDWLAGLAMQAAFSGGPIPSSASEKLYIAMHAYRMADEMLNYRDS